MSFTYSLQRKVRIFFSTALAWQSSTHHELFCFWTWEEKWLRSRRVFTKMEVVLLASSAEVLSAPESVAGLRHSRHPSWWHLLGARTTLPLPAQVKCYRTGMASIIYPPSHSPHFNSTALMKEQPEVICSKLESPKHKLSKLSLTSYPPDNGSHSPTTAPPLISSSTRERVLRFHQAVMLPCGPSDVWWGTRSRLST